MARLEDRVHRNWLSGREYSGSNAEILDEAALLHSFQYLYWLTYAQANSLGGYIVKDSTGTKILGWRKEGPKWAPSHYNLFNIDQARGIGRSDRGIPTPRHDSQEVDTASVEHIAPAPGREGQES